MSAALPPKKSVQLSGVVVAQSAVSSIDPDEGVLMYRGYDIADLAEHSTYEEVAYLLLHGELPSADELDGFREQLSQRDLPPHVEQVVDRSAAAALPMDMLRTAVSALAFTDPDRDANDRKAEVRKAARLIAQAPTIIARYHRRRQGFDPVEPRLVADSRRAGHLDRSLPRDHNFRLDDILVPVALAGRNISRQGEIGQR